MALPTASDNAFPSVLITEGTAPTSPASGKQRVYIDSTTHKLTRVNSSGTTTTIEATTNPSFHGCRVVNTAGTSISDITLTAIPFAGTETYDTDAWHDTVTNNTRITPTIAGKYRIGGTLTFATASTTGIRLIGVRFNGSTYIALDERTPGAGLSSEQYLSISTEYAFNGSTDYVELIGYQSTGSSCPLSSNGSYGAQFWASLAGV